MQKVKKILIDIREEFELLEKHIKSQKTSLLVINIPMRAIFTNSTWIKKISNKHKVYIVCRSGNRANKVKNKYFKNNKNVISLDGGIDKIKSNPIFNNNIKIITGKGGFGLQQYIQIAFVIMLTVILLLIYLNINKKILIGIVAGFMLFIVYQIYSQGCLISSLIPLSEFTRIKN